jgi:hypothetical protein
MNWSPREWARIAILKEVPQMDTTRIFSGKWLSLLAEVWSESPTTSGSDLAARVQEKLGLSSQEVAAGLVEAVEHLGDYVAMETGNEATAVDLEAEAVSVAMKVVRPVLQGKLQERMDVLDAELAGKTVCAKCGGKCRSEGRRNREWRSLLGVLRLRRRYALCTCCQAGRSPAQQALGLTEGEFTPRMEEVCTMMATTVPYGMAVNLLEKLMGVEVAVKGVEEMVERRAQALADRVGQQAEQCRPFQENGLPVDEQVRPSDATEQTVGVAYLEMDGVFPMTRRELEDEELTDEDRQRLQQAKEEKARGGKGRRYEIVGREVKNAVLYRAESCAQETPSRRCLLDKRYVSYLGDWRSFADLVWVELLRQNFDTAELLVVLSDGSEWIRSLCEWLPVKPFLILDLYHVKRRIWEVANTLYGEHTQQGSQWAQAQCRRVEHGESKAVIEGLRFLKPHRQNAQDKVNALIEYLSNNLDRMDYPRYRAMGLRVGSGAVESANYHVTGARLKLQGMRWLEQGARDMAYLRADLFNGNWETTTRALLAA